MAAQRFTRVAARLQRMLGEGCALVGGLAVSAHGYVRATRDVDLMVAMPLEDARRRLEGHGVSVRLLRGDRLAGDFHCLKGVLGGVAFDVLPLLVPSEPEQWITLQLGRDRVVVVDFETLVRLKVKAGGPQDLLDVAYLVNLTPARREGVLRLSAHDPELQRRLVGLVDDPRVRRAVAERQFEARLQRAEDRPRVRPRRRGGRRT